MAKTKERRQIIINRLLLAVSFDRFLLVLNSTKLIRNVEAKVAVIYLGADILNLHLQGSITRLNGDGKSQLLGAKNLQWIDTLVYCVLYKCCHYIIGSGLNAFQIYSLNIDSSIDSLLGL